jgi:hypothetical protein
MVVVWNTSLPPGRSSLAASGIHRQRAHGHLDRRPPRIGSSRDRDHDARIARRTQARHVGGLPVGGDPGPDRMAPSLIGRPGTPAAVEIGVTVPEGPE